MKIGVLSFHRAHNYGAVLQHYALRKKLVDLGHAVETIDFRNSLVEPKIGWKFRAAIGIALIVSRLLECCNHYILLIRLITAMKKTPLCHNFLERSLRFLKYQDFIEREFGVRLNGGLTQDQLSEACLKYDAVITGSDQIWSQDITKETWPVYLLDFIDDPEVRKLSYAASFGDNRIFSDTSSCRQLLDALKGFLAISVRENDAARHIREKLAFDVDVACDPTLLLDSEQWEQKLVAPAVDEKYLLFYGFEHSPVLAELVKTTAEARNLKVIQLFDLGEENNIGRLVKYSYPEEFLGWIRYADFTVVSSFHGLVFSIIFRKDFYAFPHSSKSSRQVSLLDRLGLGSRLIGSEDDLRSCDITGQIDYSEVNPRLNEYIEESVAFLKKALSS